MGFYDQGAKDGGFEIGIRTGLEAILASPHFIFRFEELPATAKAGERYAINNLDLASRLSFFIWGTPPDEKLIALAKSGTLSTPTVLRAQTLRLLADPRSEALATRFATQWLRLPDIDKVHPDALQYPHFHAQLSLAMQRETQLFFHSIVRENRSVLDLFRADYTYVNELLARITFKRKTGADQEALETVVVGFQRLFNLDSDQIFLLTPEKHYEMTVTDPDAAAKKG